MSRGFGLGWWHWLQGEELSLGRVWGLWHGFSTVKGV
jgi:hypothetical protein